MFEALRRAKLQREGYSCGKTRRKHQDGDFIDSLRCHPAMTGAIIVGFFVSIGLLLRFGATVADGLVQPGAPSWLYVGAIGLAALIHLRIAFQEILRDNRSLFVVLGSLVMHLAAVLGVMKFGMRQGWSGAMLVLILPHAIAPLVLSVMMGRKIGLFGAVYATLIGATISVAVIPFTYVASSALVGFLAVLFTNRVRRRNRLFTAGLYTGLAAALFSLLLTEAAGGETPVDYAMVMGMPLLSGVVTGMLIGGLLPVLESVFGVTTDISWLELADLNHPLMKRLSMEAPGTYHHSLMVASLAEAAAEAIGAGATMCRVCAYFHDIGKLTKPDYFIENMDPSENPHDDLTARMSALVLIAHVKDGVDLAIKHKLNVRIIDVIEQHHGTSLVWYFYNRALQQKEEVIRLVQEDKAKEDDVPQVSEDVFRYPGPKPQFKEAAIISLADACESASRTMEKPNASRIEALVDDIVQARMADGQLDECDLTIAELARVKASFVKTLLSMMHSRVKYTRGKTETTLAIATGVMSRDEGEPPTKEFALSQMAQSADFSAAPVPIAQQSRRKSSPRKPPPASAA